MERIRNHKSLWFFIHYVAFYKKRYITYIWKRYFCKKQPYKVLRYTINDSEI